MNGGVLRVVSLLMMVLVLGVIGISGCGVHAASPLDEVSAAVEQAEQSWLREDLVLIAAVLCAAATAFGRVESVSVEPVCQGPPPITPGTGIRAPWDGSPHPIRCDSCGAPLEKDGRCDYCGTRYGWRP